MGVTLGCKATGRYIDLGYGGFYRLRQKTAELCCPEFGEHYKSILYLHTQEDSDTFDKKTEELLARKAVDIQLVDFCLQSDCGGKISYKACQKIYDRVKNYDDNIAYGYAGKPDCARFRDFLAILKDCCDSKSNMEWY